MSELVFRASDDRFQKIKNAEDYVDLVEKFLTARETLKKNVRENKLGVSEAEFQRIAQQKPTVEAIQRLETKLENIVPSTGELVKSLKNKLEKKKEDVEEEGEEIEESEEEEEESKSAALPSLTSSSDFLDDEAVDELVEKYEAVKGPRGTLTVDKNDGTLGGEVVYKYPESRLIVVGTQKALLTEPLLELLYLPGSQILKRKYDFQTLNAFERLVSHIDKGSLGRSNKYQLILRNQELQKRALLGTKRSASKALATGRGHLMIPEDIGEAAQRLNLLCGSVAAGNDHSDLKNEISVLCDHLYKNKVLSKPEVKKIIRGYCM